MKIALEEILVYRSLKQAKSYIIKDAESAFHLVYGSRYKKVSNEELFDSIQKFVSGNLKWERLESRIVSDRDKDFHNHWIEWKDLSNEKSKNTIVDVEQIYINGVSKDIKDLKEF